MTTRKPTSASTTKVVEHLDRALEEVLAARVAMGLLAEPLPIPDEALDAALAADTRYQDARRQLREAVQALIAQAPERAHRGLVLAVAVAAKSGHW